MVKQERNIGNIYTPKSEGFWTIEGVKDRGKTATYRVYEEMSPAMNHEELIQYHINEKEKGNPFIGSAPLNMAIFLRAYELSKKNIEGIDGLKDFFKKGVQKFPSTLSRAVYMPEGEKDRVIHNYGTPEEYTLKENILGEDNWIENISDKKVLTALFGTRDTKKINNFSQWLNGTEGYLWRLNSKPSEKDERVVRFVASSYRLDLNACRNPLDQYPAFRVERIE